MCLCFHSQKSKFLRGIMTSKQIDKKNKMLLLAKESLIKKGLKDDFKKDMDQLLNFVRPEYMTSETFKNECVKVSNKYLDLSKNDIYNEYEKEIIKNSSSQVLEFMFKAYLTMCYYK